MDGLRVRVEIYKYAGYFPPEDADKIIANAEKANLEYAPQVLRNFIVHYQRSR